MGAGGSTTASQRPDKPDSIAALFPPGQNPARTDALRGRGNAAFKAKDYRSAISLYTECIQLDGGTDARLFSNRAAAHSAVGEHGRALGDACTAVELAPSWNKGHYRCAVAMMSLEQFVPAADALRRSLALDGSNGGARSLLKEAVAQGTAYGRGISTSYSWGGGDFGVLGHGDHKSCSRPKLIAALQGKSIADMACGLGHTLAVTQRGEVYSWGSNTHGQCGSSNTGPTANTPELLGALLGQRVEAVAAGAGHSLAVTSAGELYAWGVAAKGQCAVPGVDQISIPQLVSGLEFQVAAVAAGMGHSLCLSTTGVLWSCGWNHCGQLGLGDRVDRAQLTAVQLPGSVAYCSCGAGHSIAALRSGELYGWGSNSAGQLGLGDWQDRNTPVILPTSGAVALAACGEEFTIVLLRDHQVWGCGLNNVGQLGSTTPQAATSLVRIGERELAGAEVEQLACSQSQVLAVCADCRVFSWGLPADADPRSSGYAGGPELVAACSGKRVVRLQCGRRHFCITTPSCYAPHCTALGDGRSQCRVGARARFTIEAHSREDVRLTRGGDAFTAMLFHQDGECFVREVEVEDCLDGSYEVQYKVRKAGEYSLWVQQDGCHIDGSPFTLVARASICSFPDSTLTLLRATIEAGLHSDAAELCLRDSLGNKVEGSAGVYKCKFESQIASAVENIDPDKLICGVTLTKAGEYTLSCQSEGGLLVAQQKLLVEPSVTDPGTCRVEGPGAAGCGTAGTPIQFTVETFDRFGNCTEEDLGNLEIEVKGVMGPISRCIGGFGVAGHEVVYAAQQCGCYSVRVAIRGQVVHQGEVTIGPGDPDGMMSSASGDLQGCSIGPDGAPRQVQVQVCDSGGNLRVDGGDRVICCLGPTLPLSPGFKLPSTALTDVGGGVYSLEFTVPRGTQGIHMLKLELEDPLTLERQQICGSPFVAIFETDKELERQRAEMEQQEQLAREAELMERKRQQAERLAEEQRLAEEKERVAREAEIERRRIKEEREQKKREKIAEKQRKAALDKARIDELVRRRAVEALKAQQQTIERQKEAERRRCQAKRCGGGFVVNFAARPFSAGAAGERSTSPRSPPLVPKNAFE